MKKRMNRFTAGVMAAALAMTALTGCSNGGSSAATTAAPAATTAAASGDTTAAPAGETTAAESAAAAVDDLAKKLEVVPDDELYVGCSLTTMADEYMITFQENFEKMADERGIKYIIQGADSNAITQVEQIENMITMGVNVIFLWAVDVEGTADVLRKAKEKGIYVISGDEDIGYATGAVDTANGVDQYAYGYAATQMAADWIEATFPDAADGSIEVCVYSNPSSTKFEARQRALLEIENLTSKAKLVEEYNLAGETNLQPKCQEYADMMVANHPNVKVIICHSTSFGMAIDEVLQRSPSINPEEVGIFCVDWLEAGAECIVKSRDAQSCIRGLSILETTNNAYVAFHMATREILPDPESGMYYQGVLQVTSDNVEEIMAKVASGEL
ncbi:MAG: sugar ABC transporter substrate-binding protein [Lachnospiraceae bacterium]|nr:sugar ABC transporter substrate-binding protein [Lachnospiraceae bacterium]